ncbi:MAG: hypothetical protein RL204_380 [Bacteroidota bacterium]
MISQRISHTISSTSHNTDEIGISKRGYSNFIQLILVTLDLISINVSFSFSFYSSLNDYSNTNIESEHASIFVLFLSLSWLILSVVLKTYKISRVTSFEKAFQTLLVALAIHALVALTFLLSFDSIQISTPIIAVSYGGILTLFVSTRIVYHLSIKKYRSSGRNFRNTIVVGHQDSGRMISNFILDNPSLGYKLLGFFDDAPGNANSSLICIGKTDDLESYLSHHKIDEIYCALPFSEHEKIQNLIRFADNNLIRLKLVPDFQGLIKRRVEIDFYDNTPVMTLRTEPLENFGVRLVKRIFDIAFSSLVIVIGAFTIFPIIALLIKSTSKGPVFFKQMRTGANKKNFMCLKFRTMVMNESSDTKQAQQNDSRITKIGQFLRKTSLDELPQFINVLLGQMSVVGPRPHMLKHTEEYSSIIDQFMVRHFAKPGITGWAQVNGYRGNTSDPELMRKRVEYDVWYIENYTFLTDIKIIILTAISILKGDSNAY